MRELILLNNNLKDKLKKNSLKILIIFLFYLIFSINKTILDIKKDKNNNFQYNNLLSFNKCYLNEDSIINSYFNITNIYYYFSFKYKIVKVEYNIGFYNLFNNNLIIPTDLLSYNNINIFCSIEKKNNIDIYSLANIYENKYFKCIEFININEKMKFGFKIISNKKEKLKNIEYNTFFLFNEKLINYNNLKFGSEYIFSALFINKFYISLNKKFNDKNINDTLKLKKSFFQSPYCILKRYAVNMIINGFLEIFIIIIFAFVEAKIV